MHPQVTTNNIEAVRTMLELGASPNYRDSKNLSPLYHSCAAAATDPAITETLLHDHAHIGAQDLQGWQEVHQVHAQPRGKHFSDTGSNFTRREIFLNDGVKLKLL